jgi:hypothetical protein
MRATALALVVVCAGCTHTQVGVNSSAGPRSAVVSGAQVNGSGAIAALAVAGLVAAAAVEDSREARMSPGLSDWLWSRPAPQMRPDRAIQEEDCTKPIELSGNLRCR